MWWICSGKCIRSNGERREMDGTRLRFWYSREAKKLFCDWNLKQEPLANWQQVRCKVILIAVCVGTTGENTNFSRLSIRRTKFFLPPYQPSLRKLTTQPTKRVFVFAGILLTPSLVPTYVLVRTLRHIIKELIGSSKCIENFIRGISDPLSTFLEKSPKNSRDNVFLHTMRLLIKHFVRLADLFKYKDTLLWLASTHFYFECWLTNVFVKVNNHLSEQPKDRKLCHFLSLHSCEWLQGMS